MMILMLKECPYEPLRHQKISISDVGDRTDKHRLRSNAKMVLNICQLSEDKDKSVVIRKKDITDKYLIPVVTLYLEDGNVTEAKNLDDNVIYRDVVIQDFYNRVYQAYMDDTSAYKDSSELPHTVCFYELGVELDYLVHSGADRKILLVHSNLVENSSISFYQNGNILLKDTTGIRKAIESLYRLPNKLKNVDVYLIYEPTDASADYNFLVIANVYKSMLEQRGASVHIQATNQIEAL